MRRDDDRDEAKRTIETMMERTRERWWRGRDMTAQLRRKQSFQNVLFLLLNFG